MSWVWILHLLIVVLVAVAIFVPNRTYKNTVLLFLLFAAVQFMFYGRCGLTDLEYYLSGKEYGQGFIYRLMSPFLKVSESYFDMGLHLLHAAYIAILFYQLGFKLSPLMKA
jgi:hypothetical protein